MAELGDGLQPAEGAQALSDDLVDLLEVRIRELVERHRAAGRTIEKLRAQLEDRDRRIKESSGRVDSFERTRREARERIDKLIAKITRLDGSARGDTAHRAVSARAPRTKSRSR